MKPRCRGGIVPQPTSVQKWGHNGGLILGDVCFYFLRVVIVVTQSRIHLSQGENRIDGGNLFRGFAEPKPFNDSADSKPCPTNDGFSATDAFDSEDIRMFGRPPGSLAFLKSGSKCLHLFFEAMNFLVDLLNGNRFTHCISSCASWSTDFKATQLLLL
ncbi:MAG: hypothetical protein A2Z04_04480 [Chloroflexi bacterium RBG_16_57_9]|nr:MAG: hypothetical protein A2Z04_04480 [Chloroflexi bacterium RBG_16_57_9]